MNPEIRRKLVGILGMLGSGHDGERAAAGLLATKLLKSAGLTWGDIIPDRPMVPAPRPSHPAPRWRATAAFCRERDWQLTEWERLFLESISTRRALSPKQVIILDRIYDKVREDRPL